MSWQVTKVHSWSALWLLTPELTVTTNGVIEIAGDVEEQLTENKRVTLDGFWISPDGTLQAFKPHYLMKDGVLYFVRSGVLTRLEQDVSFSNGIVLRLDGILASGTRLIRLQDGQRLGLMGEVISALDHVMMVNGELVLQKDGSIVPLPAISTMGMSEGSRVTGAGLITTPSGEQFALSDGQRLTLDGAAMLMSP